MNVAQLIEILQKMPPHAEVVTHANNHHTSLPETMRVGLATTSEGAVVLVGNWGDFSLLQWRGQFAPFKATESSFAVPHFGDDAGKIIEQRHEFVAEHQIKRERYETVRAAFRLTKVGP